MIKIQEFNKEKQKISFISDMPITLANAIRRSILEIPILAVDEVEIKQNDSALFDEILAHRMGLIPLKTNKVSGKEIKFKLKKIGPTTVYSTDLSPSVGTDYKLPIVILDKNQEIELSATATLGKGIEHIKYSPGLIYYRHYIEGKSERLLDYISIDDEGKVTYDEQELKEKGISEEEMKEIKKIEKTKELMITIESWGQLDTKDVFPRSVEVLEENLEELNKAIK
jgi:DNA-directed RNA polymerase alpha subunit